MAEDTPREGAPRPRPARTPPQGSGADTGWAVIGTMISGMAVWGGVGWLLDRWLDTRVFAPVGILLGVSIAIYVVVVRYGGADPTLGRGTGKSGKTGRTSSTAGGRRSRPGTQKGRE